MLPLPLYPIREYESISVEGKYKVIQTSRTRWVLDCPSLEGNYLERRMTMLSMTLPYKMYPLYKGYNTISDVLVNRSKSKKYIDIEGKLHSWKPTAFYKTKSYKLTAKWIPRTKPVLCFALEPSCEIYSINIPNFVANYARVVELGNRRILFDVTEERMPDTRIKL